MEIIIFQHHYGSSRIFPKVQFALFLEIHLSYGTKNPNKIFFDLTVIHKQKNKINNILLFFLHPTGNLVIKSFKTELYSSFCFARFLGTKFTEFFRRICKH